MSRYIDADDAIRIWEEKDYIRLSKQERQAKKMLDELPSADVVEVVRCKDCKYAEIHKEHNVIFCEINELSGVWIKSDDYCSYGERKDDECE